MAEYHIKLDSEEERRLQQLGDNEDFQDYFFDRHDSLKIHQSIGISSFRIQTHEDGKHTCHYTVS